MQFTLVRVLGRQYAIPHGRRTGPKGICGIPIDGNRGITFGRRHRDFVGTFKESLWNFHLFLPGP